MRSRGALGGYVNAWNEICPSGSTHETSFFYPLGVPFANGPLLLYSGIIQEKFLRWCVNETFVRSFRGSYIEPCIAGQHNGSLGRGMTIRFIPTGWLVYRESTALPFGRQDGKAPLDLEHPVKRRLPTMVDIGPALLLQGKHHTMRTRLPFEAHRR